jgi:hypothetical protein
LDATVAFAAIRPEIERRVREAREWQPIETAPLNNTPVLIAYPIGRHKSMVVAHAVYIARFFEEAGESDNAEYCEEKDEYYTLPGWYEICFSSEEYSSMMIDGDPAFWMPLPAAPDATP